MEVPLLLWYSQLLLLWESIHVYSLPQKVAAEAWVLASKHLCTPVRCPLHIYHLDYGL